MGTVSDGRDGRVSYSHDYGASQPDNNFHRQQYREQHLRRFHRRSSHQKINQHYPDQSIQPSDINRPMKSIDYPIDKPLPMYALEPLTNYNYRDVNTRGGNYQDKGGTQFVNYDHQPSPTSTATSPTNTNSVDFYKTLEEKQKRWGPCFWILIVLFVVMTAMLVITLIVFFTVGKGAESTSGITVQRDGIESIVYRQGSQAAIYNRRSESHNDYVSPEFVLTAMTRGEPKICLFDTAYLNKNYIGLYNQEHISGAQHFDIERVITASETKRRNPVHPLDFQKYVRQLGVSSDCHVIVYDHGEAKNSLISATYVWWLFKVYGHKNVSIINGGLKLWKAKNFRTTQAVTFRPPEGNFAAGWDPKWMITFDDVLRNFQEDRYILVDSRTPTDFYGVTKHKLAAKGGRIKGAINIPTDTLLNPNDGSLKQVPELRRILANHGVDRSRAVIVYCNTGLQASAMYFAMVQCDIDARLYDGSWVEWSFKAPENLKETS